jgi:hypothetical protein
MKRLAALLFLISSTLMFAQTQIDPTYQIKWNFLSGSGAPSISCTQNGNYTVYPYGAEWGQSYQDTTNNVEYKCTTSGWVKNLPATGGTINGDIQVTGAVVAGASGTTVLADGTLWSTGKAYLHTWQGKTGLVGSGAGVGGVISFGMLGDSWVQNGSTRWPLAGILQGTFNTAGIGYVAFDTASRDTGIAMTTLGTWTECGTGSACYGPSASHVTSSDVATPASKSFSATAQTIVIHYLQQPGGGSFGYQTDGGSFTTVNTANATLAYGTVTISGLSLASHTLNIVITSAGTAGVILMGADCQINAYRGIRVHNLGHSGAQVADFLRVPPAMFEAGLTALGLDIMTMTLATNDQAASVLPATYGAGLGTLITEARAAIPTLDVMLTPSVDNGRTTNTYPMSQYVLAAQTTALANNTAFVNALKIFPSYAQSAALGLQNGLIHLNAGGGTSFARAVAGVLMDSVGMGGPALYYPAGSNYMHSLSSPFTGYYINEPTSGASGSGGTFSSLLNDGGGNGGTTTLSTAYANILINAGQSGSLRKIDITSAGIGEHINTSGFAKFDVGIGVVEPTSSGGGGYTGFTNDGGSNGGTTTLSTAYANLVLNAGGSTRTVALTTNGVGLHLASGGNASSDNQFTAPAFCWTGTGGPCATYTPTGTVWALNAPSANITIQAGTSGQPRTLSLFGSNGTGITISSTGLTTMSVPAVTPLSSPASSSATCTAGQMWADATYFYVCTATSTIKRAALTTF